MCCGNKRAQYHGCGRRGVNYQSQRSDGGVMAIMNALSSIKLANHGIDSSIKQGYLPAQQPATPHSADVEKGVVNDFEKDEKTLQPPAVAFEELPSYEETTGTPRVQPQPQTYTPETIFSQTNQQTRLLDGLEVFRTSLLDYQQGVRGAKKDAKRAARSVVRDVWRQEVEQRRAERSSLEYDNRKSIKHEFRSIKHEVKPLKQMLKSAVRDAKAERRGHY